MAEMKNMRSMLVSCILLIVTGLIITSIFYVTRLRKILNEEADRYLTEISQILSSSVKGRVQTNLRFLQSVSLALPDDMDYMSEENFLYLQKEAYDNAFISMGITGLDGQLKTIDGKILDISKSTLFRRVMLGESVVEASFLVSEDTDATLVYLTPIRKEEKIVAALVAHVSIDHLRATLNVESFAGKGYSYIIDSRGAIVVSSANENSEQGIKNLFEKQNNFNSEDSKNMQQDLGNGLIGSITYSIASGERKIAHYAPIGINDWFLISVVPEKMINAQTDGLIWFSTAANSITLIIVLLVCGLIFYMQRGLQRLAFSDPVTGGHNGSWFIEEAHRIIKAAAPFEYAMVSVDIEDFKLVNDFFGHAEGDRTLKYIFQRIQKHIYPNERAARMSEDNFYILIDNDSEEEVLQRLEELIQDINSFNYNSDSNYYLNLSMGVFIIDDINLELISIKDRADVARKNKEKHILSHGGTCVFYTDTERQKNGRTKGNYQSYG